MLSSIGFGWPSCLPSCETPSIYLLFYITLSFLLFFLMHFTSCVTAFFPSLYYTDSPMHFFILRLLVRLHQSVYLHSFFLYSLPLLILFSSSLPFFFFFLPLFLLPCLSVFLFPPSSLPLRLFLSLFFHLCLSVFLLFCLQLCLLFSLFCFLLCRSHSEPNAFNWAPQQTQATDLHEILSTDTSTQADRHTSTVTTTRFHTSLHTRSLIDRPTNARHALANSQHAQQHTQRANAEAH